MYAGRGVLATPILVWEQGDEVVTEEQPTLYSAYGSLHSRIAFCPICGYSFARCIMITQGGDGAERRAFVGEPIFCLKHRHKHVPQHSVFNVDNDHLLQNLIRVTKPRLAPKALLYDINILLGKENP